MTTLDDLWDNLVVAWRSRDNRSIVAARHAIEEAIRAEAVQEWRGEVYMIALAARYGGEAMDTKRRGGREKLAYIEGIADHLLDREATS